MRTLTTVSGVGFAVMLVYVQIGVFLGMFGSALDHNREEGRGAVGDGAEHAEYRLRKHVRGVRAAGAAGAGVARADNRSDELRAPAPGANRSREQARGALRPCPSHDLRGAERPVTWSAEVG